MLDKWILSNHYFSSVVWLSLHRSNLLVSSLHLKRFLKTFYRMCWHVSGPLRILWIAFPSARVNIRLTSPKLAQKFIWIHWYFTQTSRRFWWILEFSNHSCEPWTFTVWFLPHFLLYCNFILFYIVLVFFPS